MVFVVCVAVPSPNRLRSLMRRRRFNGIVSSVILLVVGFVYCNSPALTLLGAAFVVRSRDPALWGLTV